MTGMLFWKMPNLNSWKNCKLFPLKALVRTSNSEKKTSKEYNIEECQDQLAIDCGLSKDCAEMVLRRSETLNTMISNVMFLNLGEKFNCVQDPEYLNKFPNNGDWEATREAHCSQIWIEANEIFLKGFPLGEKKFFLHQGKWSNTL